MMPVANKYELHEVLEACDYYFEKPDGGSLLSTVWFTA